MLEYLDTPPDVIAIRCGGRLARSQLAGYVDRLEAAMAAHPRVHLFAEIIDFTGFDTDGFGDLIKRSAGWFRQLDRVGRVAIVADQTWVRWAAKVESALLPHISYETFESAERDRALAWVLGEIDSPHGPAFKVIETDRDDVLGFEIDGHVDKAELDAVTAQFLRAVEGRSGVRVLGRIRRLGGFEISGLLTSDFFAMKREFLEKMERYAVVGGPAWLRTTLNAMAPLFRLEIRHFEADQEDDAWTWLGARPVSERPLAR
jgi:hypothetical protein